MPVFIIAEAGVNHNGDIIKAKKLIDMAVDCGADAIKFQTFKAEESTGVFADKAEYQKENDRTQESQFEMLKKLELPFEQFYDLKKYCENAGIIFLSTPDGTDSLNCLIDIDVDLIKIGSTEITNYEFLKKIGETRKPLILSTGMSTLGEVEKAIQTINDTGNCDLRLMHCTTDYPTIVEDVNIKAMITLKQAFKLPVGYSDHTLSFEAAIAAVALGAEFIEKHITLDQNMLGPDHKASMPPDLFRNYVKYIRNTEKLLGSGIKKPTESEIINRENIRRKIVASENIEKGTVLKEEMLVLKRAGNGVTSEFMPMFIGRMLKCNIMKDQAIDWKDI